MVVHKAQDVAAKSRTEDIQLSEDLDFKSMLLPEPILQGLSKSGYIKPSPIQRKALPLVRCGLDLIVQAKAGTGKTCVFAVAALELVQPCLPHLQAVILAPTREIALQILEVVNALGQAIQDLKVCCFIGGYPLSLDQQNAAGCQIAIGAPGRILHLMNKGILDPSHARLFVIDEADKLMEKNFASDINKIFSYLPESKQVLALSATYTSEMVEFLKCYMHQGQYVTPQASVTSTVLIGIRQFVSVLPHHVDKLATLRLKERHLLYLLSSVSFNQCLIFSNLQSRAVSLCGMLRKEGWAADWISGRQLQADRVIALSQLKEHRVRLLVTTDLIARGIDMENVNFIINLDMPRDYQTYLHRMGRAGRYGSHGMVITILSAGDELVIFQKLLGTIGGTSHSVNCIPEDMRSIDLWSSTDEELKKVFGLVDKAEKEDSEKMDKSEENTKTDKISYDTCVDVKSAVLDVCVPVNCSCDMYIAHPLDVKLVCNSSLFSVSKRKTQWRDVLPVVLNECQIPLNVPFVLVDTKLIRVQRFPNKNKNKVNIQKVDNPISHFDFVEKSEETSFLTWDEIKFALEIGSVVEHSEDNEPNKNQHFLSAEEIETFLENNVLKSECTTLNLTDIDKVLLKYQNIFNELECILIDFDSFDVVGWMAVDDDDFVKRLADNTLDVYELRMIECVSGVKHIRVIKSFKNSDKVRDNIDKHISSLCLQHFNLTKPFSMESIASQLRPNSDCMRQQTNITNAFDIPSHKNLSNNNIPYSNCNEVSKNRHKINNKIKCNNQRTEDEISMKHITKLNGNTLSSFKTISNNNNTQNRAKEKNGTRIPKNRSEKAPKVLRETCQSNINETIKNGTPKEIKLNPVFKSNQEGTKAAIKTKNQYYSSYSTKCLSKSSDSTSTSEKLSKDSSEYETNEYQPSALSSSELSEDSSESETKEYQPRSISSSEISEDSSELQGKEYQQMLQYSKRLSEMARDASQSLNKSHEVHDCKEYGSDSNTTCSTESKYSSKSEMSSCLENSCIKKQPLSRQRRNIQSQCNCSSGEKSDRNSFLTACSEHLTSDSICKDHYDRDRCSIHKVDKQRCVQKQSNSCHKKTVGRCTVPLCAHATCTPLQAHFNVKNCKQRESTKRKSQSNTFHSSEGSSSYRFHRRLKSNNLFYDWYNTWYTELRQRARHLKYIEYFNTMSGSEY